MGEKKNNEAENVLQDEDISEEKVRAYAKNMKTSIAIRIAIAASAPSPEEAKLELGKLISSLSETEEKYNILIDTVRDEKKRAIRALNDAKINSHKIEVMEENA